MKPYLLLTPGPLTTSDSVKETMMTDWCTWDEDYNLHIVQELRKELLGIATKTPEEYTSAGKRYLLCRGCDWGYYR
mgnify:CR=1 FL=1